MPGAGLEDEDVARGPSFSASFLFFADPEAQGAGDGEAHGAGPGDHDVGVDRLEEWKRREREREFSMLRLREKNTAIF